MPHALVRRPVFRTGRRARARRNEGGRRPRSEPPVVPCSPFPRARALRPREAHSAPVPDVSAGGDHASAVSAVKWTRERTALPSGPEATARLGRGPGTRGPGPAQGHGRGPHHPGRTHRRLDQVYAAKTLGELEPIVADRPPTAPCHPRRSRRRPPRPRSSISASAARRAPRRRSRRRREWNVEGVGVCLASTAALAFRVGWRSTCATPTSRTLHDDSRGDHGGIDVTVPDDITTEVTGSGRSWARSRRGTRRGLTYGSPGAPRRESHAWRSGAGSRRNARPAARSRNLSRQDGSEPFGRRPCRYALRQDSYPAGSSSPTPSATSAAYDRSLHGLPGVGPDRSSNSVPRTCHPQHQKRLEAGRSTPRPRWSTRPRWKARTLPGSALTGRAGPTP